MILCLILVFNLADSTSDSNLNVWMPSSRLRTCPKLICPKCLGMDTVYRFFEGHKICGFCCKLAECKIFKEFNSISEK